MAEEQQNTAAAPDTLASHLGTEWEHDSITEKLQLAIDRLPEEGMTFAQIRDLFGQDGLMLLSIFMAIPFMIPVSIPGMSTIFGFAMVMIGISRIFGKNLRLPQKLETRVLSASKLRACLTKGLALCHKLEKLTRKHRLERIMDSRAVTIFNDCSLILAAGLLMMPLAPIPFSNTLPGLAILFLALGFLQRDGAFILAGHIFNLLTIAYFILIIIGIFFGVAWIKDMMPNHA